MKANRLAGQKRYIFIFILGMIVFLYPTFSNLYYNYVTNRSLEKDNLYVTVPSNSTEELEIMAGNIDVLDNHNEIQGIESDVEGDSIFAYIKIDKIHQTLPVYIGATDEHLNKGVAVIQGTSIPIGGENTNSIIAGHTGMVEKFFTDLPELEPGDEIVITNSLETLYYKVTGNKLILPEEEEYLSVVEGKDIITLLTCYHGTTKNDRLLVFAERYYPEEKIEYKRDIDVYSYLSEVELDAKPWYKKTNTLIISSAVILSFIFMYIFFGKKKN